MDIGIVILLGVVLTLLLGFFDFILEWEVPGGIYMVLIFGYVIFHATNTEVDPTPIAVPTEQTQALVDETKQEMHKLTEEVRVEMAEIKAEVQELNNEVVAETTQITAAVKQQDESTGNGVVIITVIIFFLVWIFSESLIVGVFIAAMCFSFLGDNLSVGNSSTDSDEPQELKQIDTSRRKYDTEYMSNRLRSKTPVYLYKDSGETVATSDPSLKDKATLIFKPKRLVKHTSGQLYACQTSKVCYPVKVYE